MKSIIKPAVTNWRWGPGSMEGAWGGRKEVGFGARLLTETIMGGVNPEGSQVRGTEPGALGFSRSSAEGCGLLTHHRSFPPCPYLRIGSITCQFEEQRTQCVWSWARELSWVLCPGGVLRLDGEGPAPSCVWERVRIHFRNPGV